MSVDDFVAFIEGPSARTSRRRERRRVRRQTTVLQSVDFDDEIEAFRLKLEQHAPVPSKIA
jgi:hypothetical protein